jgi:hypothetical protein
MRKACPNVRDYVFRSPSCSPQYLAQHFDEELERGKNPALQIGLASIVSNPNTPFELVYKVTLIRGPACTSAYEAVDRRKAEAKNFYMKLLENNPRLGLEENWDKKYPDYVFFIESFSNPSVKYNDDLLEQIYQNCPEVQDYVFRCQYCSANFLAKHFDEAYIRSVKWPTENSLEDIISNPNTPIELIEKVAASHDFEHTIGNRANLSHQAQQILNKRHSEH